MPTLRNLIPSVVHSPYCLLVASLPARDCFKRCLICFLTRVSIWSRFFDFGIITNGLQQSTFTVRENLAGAYLAYEFLGSMLMNF